VSAGTGSSTIMLAPGVRVASSEIEFRASRASGPGGQAVNTTSSRVELRWDVRRSAGLTPVQRTRLEERLGPRLTADGVLVLFGSEHRSQHRNRAAVLERLQALVTDALRPVEERRPTRPTRGSRERRLEGKRLRSWTKAMRRPPED